jgi:CRP-like cAMP-binding protein
MFLKKTPFAHFFLSRGGAHLQLDPSAFIAHPTLVMELEKHSTPISCDADRVLFRAGDAPDNLFILHDGQANVSICSSAGKSDMFFQTTARSLLGLPAVIGNLPYTLTAIACCGARVSAISREKFIGLMRHEPLITFKLLEVLAAHVHSVHSALSYR